MLWPADMASVHPRASVGTGHMLSVPTVEHWVITDNLASCFFQDIVQIPKFIFPAELVQGLCLQAAQAVWLCPAMREAICLMFLQTSRGLDGDSHGAVGRTGRGWS